MTTQHRRFPRKLIAVEVKAKDRIGLGQLQFDSMDLSAGGAFLRSDILFDEGETLELELSLFDRKIKGLARVAWSRRVAGEPGMGVEFVNLSEADRLTIENFLIS